MQQRVTVHTLGMDIVVWVAAICVAWTVLAILAGLVIGRAARVRDEMTLQQLPSAAGFEVTDPFTAGR